MIYGICPSLMKMTYAYGGDGFSVTFYTCLFALPALYVFARCTGASILVPFKTLRKLSLLALGTAFTSLFLYSSYAYIPVGMATTLHYVYPAVIAAYLRLFFKEKMNLFQIAALILSIGGIALLSCNSLSGQSLIGILLAVASGGAWAFYMVYMDKADLSKLPAGTLNFYMALANVLCAGIACCLSGTFVWFNSISIWILLIFLGIFQRMVGNAMFQVGLRGTSSFAAGIFSTFEPITSVLIGVIFLNERFSILQAVGMLLILSGIFCGTCSPQKKAMGAV